MSKFTYEGSDITTSAGGLTTTESYRIPIAPPADLPYSETPMVSREAWVKALLNQAANILEDPEIRPRMVAVIKKMIPGRVFDGFAETILSMAIRALREM